MPSIGLQSNLTGLWRPLDCFHPEQGLKKYINKSIDLMPAEVKAVARQDVAVPSRPGRTPASLWSLKQLSVGTAALNGGRVWDTP